MEKTDKNVAQLTDDEILEGFRNANEHIVKEYFYGCLLYTSPSPRDLH